MCIRDRPNPVLPRTSNEHKPPSLHVTPGRRPKAAGRSSDQYSRVGYIITPGRGPPPASSVPLVRKPEGPLWPAGGASA
eukprot:7967573-Alexandrium_andersonii.AAC.1